ncbi:MAG: host attachment protein [Gammaproteobacteria bacterium]|nr:host attachment protein [Gammaproteobacteria bacterium]
MKNTWLLIANGSEARLFETEFRPKSLTLLQEFHHPEAREKGGELASDRSGRYQGDFGTGGASHGAFNEATDPKEYEMERFAGELVQALETGRTANSYQHLVIASSPKFHGLLNKQMGAHLSNLIDKHINKDYTSLNERELLERLGQQPVGAVGT